jgi:hypothetical protein
MERLFRAMSVKNQTSLPLGIVVERRAVDNPWIDHSWRSVAVIAGARALSPFDDWTPLGDGDGWVHFHAGTLTLELFPKETEGYKLNLSQDPPRLYVVLRNEEEGLCDHEVVPFLVTANASAPIPPTRPLPDARAGRRDAEDAEDAVPMADRETNFISRWSRRKRDPRPEEEPEDEPAAEREKAAGRSAAVPTASGDPSGPADPTNPADPEDSGDDAVGDPEVVAKLPDIESLDETSDFAPFMAKGVPEFLRRRALRKLWRLNPLFANLDGLNDYDEDFTDAANLLTEIKTIYKVGKGMVSEETAEDTAGKTAEKTAGADESGVDESGEDETGEDEAGEPEVADNAGESPAIAPATSTATSTGESAAPDGEAKPDAAAKPVESASLLQDEGESSDAVPAGDAVRGTRAKMPRRSAAARRWGYTKSR